MMGGGIDASSSSSFSNAICTICYEDLKPIVEDLQSISICGHVFHELCIQQWFEYCPNGKKKCPVCKQTCSASAVTRLYFQSNPNELKVSQKQQVHEVDKEELQFEVRILEGKVKGLTSVLETQQNDLKNVSEELSVCKEELKKEVALKIEALEQTRIVNRLLTMKSEELDSSSLECIRLKERNKGLAKELAALKLLSDLNLEEEEVQKLASLGTEANSKETIGILRKSLVVRNKMYKELITKCNTLGRDEARCRKKLEKAKEKVERLKIRIQELEMANETEENEILRKVSRKTDISANVDSTFIGICKQEDKIKEPTKLQPVLDQAASMSKDQFSTRKTKRLRSSEDIGTANNKNGVSSPGQGLSSYIIIDDEAPEVSRSHEFLSSGSVPRGNKDASNITSSLSRPGKESHSGHETNQKDGVLRHTCVDEDVVLVPRSAEDIPLSNVTKETSSSLLNSREGDFCFSGGLLGPDGSNWHLGKWCKKGQSRGLKTSSIPTQGSGASTGDLIAVGADGRGGRIKVLRSQNSSSLEYKGTSSWGNNGKFGAKTSGLQTKGCLQIDHFFRKAGQ